MTLTRSQNMARIKSKDTKPELLLRRALWRQGLRYRLQYRIENIRPDIVFVKARVALFIDGCQWHGCPEHYARPRTNQVFWDQRLRVNAERDTKQTVLLRATGWIPYRIWEHDICFVRQISLNAQDFGVPQSRNRLFLLCALSEKVNFNTPHLACFRHRTDVFIQQLVVIGKSHTTCRNSPVFAQTFYATACGKRLMTYYPLGCRKQA